MESFIEMPPQNWQSFQNLLKQITSTKKRTKDLLDSFEEYASYADIFVQTWKELKVIVEKSKNEDCDDIFVSNILDLLEKIPLTKVITKQTSENTVSSDQTYLLKGEQFTFEVKELKKCITRVWRGLLNKTITPPVHRRLLIVLLESYISSLHNPVYLTDFFMSSMNYGGAISLLALQGMSMLIQKHNIEYPNIYGKLYTMFEPEILHTKYKSRLLYLADIFLSSTYLPECLIAAFVKRIARLCLTAQVPDILMMLRFIEIILIRNPGLKRLIQHPTISEVDADPFIMEEQDPYKSRALESSLWELQLLKNHAQPRISSAARFIDCNLRTMELDLSEVLDKTSENIFDGETRKSTMNSLTFVRPHSLAALKDNRLCKMWSLT